MRSESFCVAQEVGALNERPALFGVLRGERKDLDARVLTNARGHREEFARGDRRERALWVARGIEFRGEGVREGVGGGAVAEGKNVLCGEGLHAFTVSCATWGEPNLGRGRSLEICLSC